MANVRFGTGLNLGSAAREEILRRLRLMLEGNLRLEAGMLRHLQPTVMLWALPLFAAGPGEPAASNGACPVTKPNGSTPPGERSCPNCLGNGDQWAGLYPDGKVVFAPGGPGFVLEDGSLSMKFWWWRVRGKLTITGRRLDAIAPPLRARIPEGYGDTGFQATALIFPTVGCWQVTGKVGESRLTFVTLVVKDEKRR